MLPEQLSGWLSEQGVRHQPRDARRLLAHVLFSGHDDLSTLVGLPRRVLEAVEAGLCREHLEVLERATDPSDGFVKYLFRSPDGALSEAVRIPLHLPERFAICLSSQVGCAMACAFCATGRMGLERNLEVWEMLSAYRIVRDEAPGRVTGALFQGQGEPFQNYQAVIQAAQLLSHPCGGRLSAKAITISTVGLVAQIRRFTAERHKYRLIVSLTSAREALRKKLCPVAGQTKLSELAEAIRAHAAVSPGLTTVALVMLGGVNTDIEEVQALAALLGGMPLRLNLIDVNDSRPGGFRPPTDEELKRFRDDLRVLRAPIVRRYSGGQSRHAACGMLASRRVEQSP